MRYRPPGTSVDVLLNPNIMNATEPERFVAIVGIGRETITIPDEAVERGTSEESDLLDVHPAAGVVVTQVSSIPGVDPNDVILSKKISEGGVLFDTDALTVDTTGSLTWDEDATGVHSDDIPDEDQVYYVTYRFATPSEQYGPHIYTSGDVIARWYGAENNTLGILTVGGKVVLENGAAGVMINQVNTADEGVVTVPEYRAAIDKLKNKTNVEYVVVVFPKGTAQSLQEEIIAYAYGHVAQMNTKELERGLLTGSPSAQYTEGDGGFDSVQGHVIRSSQLRNKSVSYVAETTAHRRVGSDMLLFDGNFLAASIGGLRLAQPKWSTPIHGRRLQGFVVEDDKWNRVELDQLGAASTVVLTSSGGFVTVRDDLTTDPMSADTQEPSVRQQERLLKRTLRNRLHDALTSRGNVINETTPGDVISATRAILQSLVNQGELFAFGERDDPSTGELQITAEQSKVEPRLISVTAAVRYLYPLKWLDISVSLFI